MRAAVLEGYGEELQVYDDVEIEAPHAGEVQVRVHHCGVCHSDLSVVDGTLPAPVPSVLGHEASGVVEAVGEGVTMVAVGDHVVLTPCSPCGRCFYCQRGEAAICVNSMELVASTMLDGGTRLSRGGELLYRGLGVGAFGELVTAQQTAAVKIPAEVPLEVACVIGCAVQTGVGAVINTAEVAPGETVLVTGLGGVGLSIVQGAVLAGASRIVVSDPVAARREAALSFGATDALDPTTDDVVTAAHDLTAGIGVDYAFEAAGRAALIDLGLMATRSGGTTVVVGVPPIDEALTINPVAMFQTFEKKLLGSLLGSTNSLRDIPRLVALWQTGRLDLEGLITARRPLDGINEAFADLRQRGVFARSLTSDLGRTDRPGAAATADADTVPGTTNVPPVPGDVSIWRTRLDRWWRPVVAVVAVVLLVGPPVVAGVAGALRHWLPAGDWALLELRTRDVGSAATPLIGPYSRFGWNHPGPLLFWLFAVPYRLSGSRSGSMMFGAAAVNVSALVGMAIFAWRRGRVALVVIAAALGAVLMTYLGPSFLRDPWNPSVTVLPLVFFVMLVWSCTEGDGAALPLAALVGSFLVEAHVGFAAIVAGLWALALVGFVLTRRRREAPLRKPLVVAGAVLFVCWLPLVIDQFAGTGNLGHLLDYFTSGAEAAAGFGRALGVTGRELGRVPPWMGSPEGINADGSVISASHQAFVVPLVAFVAAAVAAWSARHRDQALARAALTLQLTVFVGAALGVFSVARITGPVFNYLVRWWWVLAMMWWLSVAWSCFVWLVAGRPKVRRGLEPAVIVAALLVTVVFSQRTVDGVDEIGTPDGGWYVPLEGITADTLAGVPRSGPLLVRAYGSRDASVADGMRLQLERSGADVVVDDELVFKYGRSRRASSHHPDAVVWVVTGPSIGEFAARDDVHQVALWDPLDAAPRVDFTQRADALSVQLASLGRDDLVEALRTGGSLDPARDLDGIDQALLAGVEDDRRKGDPVAVFVEPVAADEPVPAPLPPP